MKKRLITRGSAHFPHAGQPSPRVSWYQEQQVLDEEAEPLGNQMMNTLHLGPLTREHLGKNYSCQAVNSDLVGPRSKEVTLQMYRTY